MVRPLIIRSFKRIFFTWWFIQLYEIEIGNRVTGDGSFNLDSVANFTGGDFNNIEKSPLTSFHAGGIVRWKFDHLILQG